MQAWEELSEFKILQINICFLSTQVKNKLNNWQSKLKKNCNHVPRWPDVVRNVTTQWREPTVALSYHQHMIVYHVVYIIIFILVMYRIYLLF